MAATMLSSSTPAFAILIMSAFVRGGPEGFVGLAVLFEPEPVAALLVDAEPPFVESVVVFEPVFTPFVDAGPLSVVPRVVFELALVLLLSPASELPVVFEAASASSLVFAP